MGTVLETIRRRESVRMYSDRTVETEKIEALSAYISEHTAGPFGNKVRFTFVDTSGYDQTEIRKLGTYSMIRGAKLYLVGSIKNTSQAMEDFGYCMERVILAATELDLGTCWCGGAIDRRVFGDKIELPEDEIIPAATPIGYASEKKRLYIEVARTVVMRSTKRKDPAALFFEGDRKTPLDLTQIGSYAEVLEAVRQGPSAGNMQPWRFIRIPGTNTFHLYLDENTAYNNAFLPTKLQNLDMGIAMCHFEAAARDLHLAGSWTASGNAPEAGKWIPIASWKGE